MQSKNINKVDSIVNLFKKNPRRVSCRIIIKRDFPKRQKIFFVIHKPRVFKSQVQFNKNVLTFTQLDIINPCLRFGKF